MSKTKQLIEDGESLVSARFKSSGVDIPTYDDGFGKLFIHRDSMGVRGIVRARTWEDAYSICEDEFFPEADEIVDENELFQEAFGFRPNGPNSKDKLNHGIYAKDLNGDALDPLTSVLADDLGIELTIKDET